MKLNILMVQKQNLINVNWNPKQKVLEPKNGINRNTIRIDTNENEVVF